MTTSAFLAICKALFTSDVFSVLFTFKGWVKEVFPSIRSTPFSKNSVLSLYFESPSCTDTAVLSSEASLQLPKGLFLSFAKGPIKAIFCPLFFRGKRLFSFLSNTIDFLATSKTAL